MTDDPLVAQPDGDRAWDLLGVGIGPVSLSLAALASTVPGMTTVFLDRSPEFRRHHGRAVDGFPVRVSFLADLVSLVAPAHPLSFLSYLADRGRIFPFYAAGRSSVDRAEYDDYCQWVVARLPDCRFGHDVQAVRWSERDDAFAVTAGADTFLARNVVLGLGAVPAIPVSLRLLAEDPAALVVHAADYPRKRPGLTVAGELAVIGAGQSAAEVFLDLVRRRPPGRERVRWFTPGPSDHGVGPETLAQIQDELYRRGVRHGWPDVTVTPDAEVLAARRVDDRIELDLRLGLGDRDRVLTDGVVLATGYRERPMAPLLGPLADRLRRDGDGRLAVDDDYRLLLDPCPGDGAIYLPNVEPRLPPHHPHCAPGPGLGAWRAAVVLNALCGRPVYRLPDRAAFSRFGLVRQPHSVI